MTNFASIPTAYRAMAAAGADVIRRYQLNVRAMSSAGEPLNPEVIRFFQEHVGVTIHDHYGLSETLMLSASSCAIKNGKNASKLDE